MMARLPFQPLFLSLLFVLEASGAWAQSPGGAGGSSATTPPVIATATPASPAVLTTTSSAAPTAKGPDLAAVVRDVRDPNFRQVLFIALLFGGLGGLVYELLVLQGQIELPHKTTAEDAVQGTQIAIWRFTFDLGIFARLIIGAFAAVAILWVLSPPSGFALLATSLIAGSAGSSIFRSLEDRLLAVVSQKDAQDTRKKADTLNAKVEAAEKSITSAQVRLSPQAVAGVLAAPPPDHAGALADLQQAARAIADAKAVYETIRR
jgi:hypothetical protein